MKTQLQYFHLQTILFMTCSNDQKKKCELVNVPTTACLGQTEPPTSSVSFVAASVVLHEVNDITDAVTEAKVMKMLVGFPGWRAVADGGWRAYPPGMENNANLVVQWQMHSL